MTQATEVLRFAKEFVRDASLRADYTEDPDATLTSFGIGGNLATSVKAAFDGCSVEDLGDKTVLGIHLEGINNEVWY